MTESEDFRYVSTLVLQDSVQMQARHAHSAGGNFIAATMHTDMLHMHKKFDLHLQVLEMSLCDGLSNEPISGAGVLPERLPWLEQSVRLMPAGFTDANNCLHAVKACSVCKRTVLRYAVESGSHSLWCSYALFSRTSCVELCQHISLYGTQAVLESPILLATDELSEHVLYGNICVRS